MNSENREDYLRAIFCLNEDGVSKVRSVHIAKYLDVSKPAVSEMLRKLKENGLVEMKPYSHITLTFKGFEVAKKLTYKHRVIELFLKETLNLDDKEMHEEAHRLEHAMSEKVVQKIADFMKNPSICPCGRKIPNLTD